MSQQMRRCPAAPVSQHRWALSILLEGCSSAPLTLRDQGCSASVGQSVSSTAATVSSKNRTAETACELKEKLSALSELAKEL